MIDPTYTRSFWYFDERSMILENLGWSDGKGDSVGRNAFAYICYPNLTFLKESILQCIKVRDDTYVQFYRYPGYGADTMSRDHVGAIILALYINRDRSELKWILENLPWRLSRKHTQTIDFWLWHRALHYTGWKRFILSGLFCALNLLMFSIVVPYNGICRQVIGIRKIDPYDDPKFEKLTGWRMKVYRSLYPHYALFLLAWQIRVLPNSWFKVILKKLLLIESGNIVIDTLLGKKIVDFKYKPTTSFIWSRRLDSADDILIRPMTVEESKCNDLNQSMIDYLRLKIDVLMLDFDDGIVNAIKQNKSFINY